MSNRITQQYSVVRTQMIFVIENTLAVLEFVFMMMTLNFLFIVDIVKVLPYYNYNIIVNRYDILAFKNSCIVKRCDSV